MLTRSKAMKRSANDDISVSPTKSPRRQSGSSNEVNIRPESNPGHDGSSSRPEETSDASEPQEDVEQANESLSHNAQSPRKDRNAAGDRSVEDSKQTDNGTTAEDEGEDEREDEEKKARKEQEAADQRKAIKLIMQLLMILEKWRNQEDGSTILGAQPTGMARLCELSADPELTTNQFLEVLPFEFYWEMQHIQEGVAKANNAKHELETLEADVVAAGKIHTDALNHQGLALLRVRDHSEEAMQAHKAAVSNALQALKKVRADRNKVKEKWQYFLSDVDERCEVPFQKAEAALVEDGILEPLPNHEQHSREPGDEEPRTIPEAREARHQHRDERSDRSPPAPDRDHEEAGSGSPSEVDVVRDVRREKMRFVEHTRRECEHAEDRFLRVRSNYYHDLDEFLDKQRRGLAIGGKADFDLSYYLARKQANHNYAMARRDWEFALEQADETGALTVQQRRMWLGDPGESDHGSGVFVRDPIWELTEADIDIWNEQVRLEGTVSERHWQSMQTEVKQEGRSVAGFSELELRNWTAGGKERRLIDEWVAEQEKVRKSFQSNMTVRDDEAPSGLPWWQMWNGI